MVDKIGFIKILYSFLINIIVYNCTVPYCTAFNVNLPCDKPWHREIYSCHTLKSPHLPLEFFCLPFSRISPFFLIFTKLMARKYSCALALTFTLSYFSKDGFLCYTSGAGDGGNWIRRQIRRPHNAAGRILLGWLILITFY